MRGIVLQQAIGDQKSMSRTLSWQSDRKIAFLPYVFKSNLVNKIIKLSLFFLQSEETQINLPLSSPASKRRTEFAIYMVISVYNGRIVMFKYNFRELDLNVRYSSPVGYWRSKIHFFCSGTRESPFLPYAFKSNLVYEITKLKDISRT